MMRNRLLDRLMLAGLLSAALVAGLAVARYPGGYDWSRDFISTLFAEITPSGRENFARRLAIGSMALFCGSVALLFQLISSRASAPHGKIIQIAGIGSMVYAVLTVTPMHDLMVTIALVFYLVAIGATLHRLYVDRSIGLVLAGGVSLALVVASASMYYLQDLPVLLPAAQKLVFATNLVWLLAVRFEQRGRARLES